MGSRINCNILDCALVGISEKKVYKPNIKAAEEVGGCLGLLCTFVFPVPVAWVELVLVSVQASASPNKGICNPLIDIVCDRHFLKNIP